MRIENDDIKVDIAAALGARASLVQRFAILIPNQDFEGKPVDQAKWVDKAMELLTRINGGATQMPPSRGFWLNDDGVIVKEERC
jgi:hypothetical protein